MSAVPSPQPAADRRADHTVRQTSSYVIDHSIRRNQALSREIAPGLGTGNPNSSVSSKLRDSTHPTSEVIRDHRRSSALISRSSALISALTQRSAILTCVRASEAIRGTQEAIDETHLRESLRGNQRHSRGN